MEKNSRENSRMNNTLHQVDMNQIASYSARSVCSGEELSKVDILRARGYRDRSRKSN